MFGNRDRIEEVAVTDDGYEVITRRPQTADVESVKDDSPPEHFVEPIEQDGGTVYAIPFMEALREALRRKRDNN